MNEHQLIRRIHADLVDSDDEELELELDERTVDDISGVSIEPDAYQAHHAAAEPACRKRRRAAGAERSRAHAVVLPAQRCIPAGGRREGAARPALVQPRRCRARDGLLRRRAVRGVLPYRARLRTHAGALGQPDDAFGRSAIGALTICMRWKSALSTRTPICSSIAMLPCWRRLFGSAGARAVARRADRVAFVATRWLSRVRRKHGAWRRSWPSPRHG